jgi:osmotically-inducible protein OsmY
MIVRTDPAYLPRLETLTQTAQQTLTQAAQKRLALSPYHVIRKLSCECSDEGILVLRGHLPSFYHKQLAQHAVLGLEGVTRVLNQVTVAS